MVDRIKLIQDLLLEAIEIEDADKQSAFLTEACGSDVDLREELEELIQAEGAAGQSLPGEPLVAGPRASLRRAIEALTNPPTAPCSLLIEKPGDRIGRYILLKKIGEGGCGIVYLAGQEEPVRRQVALKVIKLGMDTREVVARFEAERQALALMDHSNIAKVFDAGATEAGRPFFVMELVQGVRITDYCVRNSLATQAKLELFIKVCQAIQHAHQKGVIHRDIKPSNVLVTLVDGIAVPKVIDFGIAKATEGRLTGLTMATAFEQFLGTPAYMSPEQAALASGDVDTRSDIYSLGVLLYELLTGSTPFDTKALLASGLDELRRTIREKEPVRPSLRLSARITTLTMRSANGNGQPPESQSAEAANAFSSRRLAETKALVKVVRGDLDWIVMKCLEKDRARRYETPNGLALDIQRHLEAQPVLARPPSRLYEFQRTFQRHKVAFATTTLVIAALALGTFISTLQAIRARKAERGEIRSQQHAEKEAKNARLAEADAKEKLRGAYLAQAQAGRWSRRAGRRFEGLELLKKAAAIAPSRELRDEAIACMALSDVRTLKDVEALPKDGNLYSIDCAYERYAFADANWNVHLRRMSDNSESLMLPGYGPKVKSLQFSPDGRLLLVAWGRDDENLEVINLVDKERVLQNSEAHFRTAVFNSDSRLLAVTYEQPNHDFPVRIFDLVLKTQIASFPHGSLVHDLRFNPKQSERLLTSDQTSIVRIWDWKTGQIVRQFNHPDGVGGVDWHPGGEIVATGCADYKVRLWDAGTGAELVRLEGHEGIPVQVSFSFGGDFLATRGWDGVLRLWQPFERHTSVNRPVIGFSYPFSPTGNRLGIATGTGRFGVLEVAGGIGFRVLQTAFPSDEPALSCEFSPGGRFLVSTDSHGMRLWDLLGLKQLARVSERRDWDHLAAFDVHGTNIFLAGAEGIETWSIVGKPRQDQFELHPVRTINITGQHGRILLSSDGRTVGTGARDTLRLFDSATSQEIRQLNGPYNDMFSALSPDAHLAATWDRFSTNVQIWDVAKSNVFLNLPAHDAICAAFSPNGEWFMVGDAVEFRAWDAHTWKPVYSLPRDGAGYWGFLAYSGKSQLLAVAFSRSTVKLVEPETGRELATLEAPEPADIHWIAFNDEGTQLAVVTALGAIQLWDLRLVRQQLAALKLDWDLPY